MLSSNELKILKHLRENSRKPVTAIASTTGIPKSTVFDNIERLRNGLIRRHVTIMDFSKMGYGLRVNVVISTDSKKQMREYLCDHNNVNSLYRVAGGSDFIAEGIFRNIAELELFKEEVRSIGVKEMQIFHTLEEIKYEEFLPES